MDLGTLRFSRNGRDLGLAVQGLEGTLYPSFSMYNRCGRSVAVSYVRRTGGVDSNKAGSILLEQYHVSAEPARSQIHIPSAGIQGEILGCVVHTITRLQAAINIFLSGVTS